MSIQHHPAKGTVLMCDFNTGFTPPEMVKRRPVVVISPAIKSRGQVCTVVCLSTAKPDNIMPYHTIISLPPNFPDWLHKRHTWVKGDMIYTVAFKRLDLLRSEKDRAGKRRYLYTPLNSDCLREIEQCVLRGMGLSHLTKHL